MNLEKYSGVIPAFYACYDEKGEVSTEGTRALARHLVGKGVKGLYVGGSSGECIYLEKEERMKTLEAVMAEYAGKRHGLHYAFHTVPDAVMKGTAIAALG